MKNSILIIDNDLDSCNKVSNYLDKKGFRTLKAHDADDGIEILKKEEISLVLFDYSIPHSDGTAMIEKIRIARPEAVIIVITGYKDVNLAVSSLKKGVYDYITKPLYPDELLSSVQDAIEKYEHRDQTPDQPSKKRSTSTRKKVTKDFTHENSLGESDHMKNIWKQARLVAPTDMTVIITGETGTGKEYVARAIHFFSKRKEKPFVAVDCGALPKDLAGSELFGHKKGAFTGATQDKPGSFEVANGGTLFLDEIGNLTYENQVKLLRVLQERKIRRIGDTKEIPVDVRVLTATNEDLQELLKDGTFREDIYHRLNEFKINLLPIRQRQEDVVFFANHFLETANQKLEKSVEKFSKEVIDKFRSYDWPGNLRELRNAVKRAVLLTEENIVKAHSLPTEIMMPGNNGHSHRAMLGSDFKDCSLKQVVEIAERQAIIDALEKTGYNKSKTAKKLDIDRKTLYNKLKAYEIAL